jgi:hypothetical protein
MSANARLDRGFFGVNIAYQPATTTEAGSARPSPALSAHGLVLIEEPPRVYTVAKIAGLLAITALGTAVLTAIVAGTALFALLNFG